VIFSRRNLSAPQSKWTNSMGAIMFGGGGLDGFDGDRRDFLCQCRRRGMTGDARAFGTAAAEGKIGHVLFAPMDFGRELR